MTRQLKKLTAEDLDCYTDLFSGIAKKFQQFSYHNLYLYDVKKTLRILNIYREWLLSQQNQDFTELYNKFWRQCEMNITAVSLLLVPAEHDKKYEIARIEHLLEMIYQNENNSKYSNKLQDFLNAYPEPYPDANILIGFFENDQENENLNTNK